MDTSKRTDEKKDTIELTSAAANSTAEMIEDSVRNNSPLQTNALLHELELVTHDGNK